MVPLGEVEFRVLYHLQGELGKRFAQEVEITFSGEVPNFAYSPRRKQYHSTSILNRLKKLKKGELERILGIVDVDLYVPPLNFVFGEADLKEKAGIISLARLSQEYYRLPPDGNIFLLRALKEAVHELGHTYGLYHCKDSNCVMFFSNSILDTDQKQPDFCPSCKKKLEAVQGEEERREF